MIMTPMKSSLVNAICDVQFVKSIYPAIFGLMYSPYFIIVFCYWKIYRKVKMHNANLSLQSSNVAGVKVSKTFFVTVVSFFTLLFPAHIIFNLARFVGPSNFPRFLSLLAVLSIL